MQKLSLKNFLHLKKVFIKKQNFIREITHSAAQSLAAYKSIRGMTAFSKKTQLKNFNTFFYAFKETQE